MIHCIISITDSLECRSSHPWDFSTWTLSLEALSRLARHSVLRFQHLANFQERPFSASFTSHQLHASAVVYCCVQQPKNKRNQDDDMTRPYCAKNIKNLFFYPAKSTEVSPEGNFKDSTTRKRWLGTHPDFPAVLPLLPRVVGLPVGPGGEGQQLGAALIGGPAVVALLRASYTKITCLHFHISTFPHLATFLHQCKFCVICPWLT